MALSAHTSGTLDLELYAGDRNDFVLSFTSAGDVWNMTGATISAQARKKKTSSVASLTATVTAVDEATGQWLLEWDGDEVRSTLGGLASWEGFWDLQVLESGQTYPITLLRGSVTIYLDVTR
jgi:hypothetical protein